MDYFKTKQAQDEERSVFLNRVLFSSLAILLLGGLIISRLIYLMVIESDELSLRSVNNTLRTQSIPAPRGLIYDRNIEVIAENKPKFQLEMVPEQVNKLESSLLYLTELGILDENEISTIEQRVKRNYQFKSIVIKRDLDEREMAIFANNRMLLKGFEIKSRLTRNYPQNEIYAHVVGYMGSISSSDYQRFDPVFYTGKEQIGKSAIEREYEHILRGVPGKRKLLVNVRGRIMDEVEKEAFTSGNDIILTLNSELQRTAYESMIGKKGSVVAMDPRNGEILAMVSMPSFNPTAISLGLSQSDFNKLNRDKKKPLFNRATAGQYPPGSTVKPMLALGALDMGIVDSEYYLPCEGEFKLPNYSRPFRDWAAHGSVNAKRAIQASCDVYFYEIAVEMGIERMSEFLKNFNLGEKTKLDLGNEKKGVVPNQEWKRNNFKSKENQNWYLGETVIAGIGQGYMLATPMQLAYATSIIANRGFAFKPHVLKQINLKDSDEALKTQSERIDHVMNIDDKYWDIVFDGMNAVVNEQRGTAYGVFPENSDIAGKTGTSQVFNMDKRSGDDVPEELRDHGLFIGFAPINDPEIVIAVLVENGGGGRVAAAPVAEKMFSKFQEIRGK
jgi:penicillin-binding protein 2